MRVSYNFICKSRMAEKNLIKRLYLSPLITSFPFPDAYLGSNSLLDEDLDDEFVVQDILQDLMGKQLVKEDILNDLGMEKLTKNFTDPTPKMEQRHKLVRIIKKV